MHTPSSKRPTYLFMLPWSLAHLGGVNQVVINLAREMVKAGSFEPIILINDWNATTPKWEDFQGLRTVRWCIRAYGTRMRIKERVGYLLWEQRFRPAFSRFCRENQVAAINMHYVEQSAFTLDRLIRKLDAPIPLILSFHGADLSHLRDSSLDVIAKWNSLLSRIKGIVVCSKDLGIKVTEIFGDAAIPHIIHNGLNVTDFVAMANNTLPTTERIILNVAKFEDKKGQDILIEAFAAISNDYNDVSLYLVGATDKALAELKRLCANKAIQDRVHFFPDTPHHQVADFFRQAAIFVLPSRQEPFGIVLLEAGAFALPVIATQVGGIPEILTEGETGHLVPPNNASELAQCLRSVLDNPSKANDMGARLHNHVILNFTWTATHNKYVALAASEAPDK